MMKDQSIHFPFSDQPGGDTSGINYDLMRQAAQKNPVLTAEELAAILSSHHVFLSNGGAGGTWKTAVLKGLVWGIYDGRETTDGRQASFEHRVILQDLCFEKMALPFSNWCGAITHNLEAGEAELSYALMTDAVLEQADFRGARLSNVDFSRANLCDADFRKADLTGCDFENANLTGADFRNTRLLGARFPGAVLEGVKY